MKKTIKLKAMNMPISFPISTTISTYLLLDKLRVSDIIWGIYITITLFWWIILIIGFILELKGKTAEILEDGRIEVK